MTTTVNSSGITFNDGTSTTTNLIPSGTVMVFYQASAPTGWTQNTSLNDYALRIVSGTGGGTGGSTGFSSVFTNQTPTINVSGLSAAATTLSTSQMPSHNHTPTFGGKTIGNSSPPPAGFVMNGCFNCYGAGTCRMTTTSTGSGGSHTHSISGSASSSAITLNVQYANHILASKN